VNKELFLFRDYKAYLLEVLKKSPNRGHGFRSRLAEAAKCRLSYISQVLHKHAHLSLEQAEAINLLLGHNSAESDYFLLLIQLARAGTPALRSRLEHQAQEAQEKNKQLKNRVAYSKTISPEEQQLYYSSWIYSAVHILVTVPEYRDREALARRLQVPIEKVHSVVRALVGMQLLHEKEGKLTPAENRIFLPADSPLVKNHHANWRLRALELVDPANKQDLHITSVVSISEEDGKLIREKLLAAFASVNQIVRPSKEEELFTICLDFFRA
jgi:uncharacterized protein (TIGR02147 family)